MEAANITPWQKRSSLNSRPLASATSWTQLKIKTPGNTIVFSSFFSFFLRNPSHMPPNKSAISEIFKFHVRRNI